MCGTVLELPARHRQNSGAQRWCQPEFGQTVDRVNTDPPSFFTPTFDHRAGIAPVFSVGSNNKADLSTNTPETFWLYGAAFAATGLDSRGGIPCANAAIDAINPYFRNPAAYPPR